MHTVRADMAMTIHKASYLRLASYLSVQMLLCLNCTKLGVTPSFIMCRARVANPEEHWEMIRVPFGTGIAGKVAESGTSLNIPDAYACGLFNPAIDKKTGFRTRNILCCPISDMAGNHVAVIQVQHKLCASNLQLTRMFCSHASYRSLHKLCYLSCWSDTRLQSNQLISSMEGCLPDAAAQLEADRLVSIKACLAAPCTDTKSALCCGSQS